MHENNAPANLWGFALRYFALILNYSPIRSKAEYLIGYLPTNLSLEKSRIINVFTHFIAPDCTMCIKKRDQTLLFLTIKQNPVTSLVILKKVK